MPDLDNPWIFLPIGYLFSILIETPILMIGLSPRHPMLRRFLAGLWLTACTYPVVILVLPQVFSVEEQLWLYLLVAETFAPAAECLLFWLAFGMGGTRREVIRDCVVITIANVASFLAGEMWHHWPQIAGWFTTGS